MGNSISNPFALPGSRDESQSANPCPWVTMTTEHKQHCMAGRRWGSGTDNGTSTADSGADDGASRSGSGTLPDGGSTPFVSRSTNMGPSPPGGTEVEDEDDVARAPQSCVGWGLRCGQERGNTLGRGKRVWRCIKTLFET